MDENRSQHHRQTLNSLNGLTPARPSFSRATRRDTPIDGMWSDALRPLPSADVADSPFSRVPLTPQPNPQRSWSHPFSIDTTSVSELDTESQTQTLVQEAGGERVNRMSQLMTRLTLWQRLRGKGRRRIGWGESCKNMATFSCKSS